MSFTPISVEQFENFVRPIIGMPVALPWKGWGSAIFLELGQTTPVQSGRRMTEQGEACVQIQWDWRVESGTRVLYGSSNTRPRIERGIQSLRASKLERLVVNGRIPELVLHFSNGQCLRSMVMKGGDPEWVLRLPDGKWLSCEAGVLLAGTGHEKSEMSKEEAEANALADVATTRWGSPSAQPVLGRCHDCKSVVRLDSEGSFMDYGVCIESRSPLDGRVVASNSGCPAFTSSKPPKK